MDIWMYIGFVVSLLYFTVFEKTVTENKSVNIYTIVGFIIGILIVSFVWPLSLLAAVDELKKKYGKK